MFTICDENFLFYTEFAVCKQLFGCRSIWVPKPFASYADSDTSSNKNSKKAQIFVFHSFFLSLFNFVFHLAKIYSQADKLKRLFVYQTKSSICNTFFSFVRRVKIILEIEFATPENGTTNINCSSDIMAKVIA